MPKALRRRRITDLIRIFILLSAFLLTGWGGMVFGRIVMSGFVTLSDFPLFVLFVVLFLWIAINFISVLSGFVRQLVSGQQQLDFFDRTTADETRYKDLPRTAVVIPVYNEDPHEVFAGIYAMHDSIVKTGHLDKFDFYVMSDTTKPEVWVQEEMQLIRIRAELGSRIRIHYRRRPKNTARKSGNIEDFIERWGGRYSYMIVLDADSTMSARSMLEMAWRIHKDQKIGILQVPPFPSSRRSLFARLQQFSSSMYGAVFGSGFTSWTNTTGNFFGHNAIIRLEAFAKHCKLPILPGKPPLGGEILSHDFVEAALIKRAGYSVVTTDDLPGSYEECPTTLLDFAKRDQRWCQGNMQHLKIAFRPGFHWVSRLHFMTGAMAYLSSPLWFLFILCGLWNIWETQTRFELAPPDSRMAIYDAAGSAWLLFGVTMSLLLLPKLFSFILLLRNPWVVNWFGGYLKAAASILLETLFSIVMAPVMMVFHTVFVVSTAMGRKVQWTAQNRDEQELALGEAVTQYSLHIYTGVLLGLVALMISPVQFVFLLPITGSLVFSPVLAVLLSSVKLGDGARQRGILLTRSEVFPPHVISRKHWHLARLRDLAMQETNKDSLQQVITDPILNALHCSLLRMTVPPAPTSSRQDRRRWALLAIHGGGGRLSAEEKVALLNDPVTLRWAHRASWTGETEWDTDIREIIRSRPAVRRRKSAEPRGEA
jgi:membrane glycosyltransferase